MSGKKLFKVWDRERVERRMIFSEPTLEKVLEAAKKKGLIGEMLYTESDGCLIDEDELLELLWETPLLLLKEDEKWEAAPTPSTSHEYLNESSNMIFSDLNSINKIVVPSSTPFVEEFSLSDTSLGTTMSMTSMTSGVLSENGSQSSVGLQQTTVLFEHFQIPWSKVPTNILKMCEKGEQLGPHLKTVIHIIINELRSINYYIPVSAIRLVVGKMISKYPKSFMCTDTSGQTISIHHSPLITSFIQRNNYLNRPNISKPQSPNIPLKKKRISKNFESTCINWQPKLNEEKEDLNELAAKQLFLIDKSKRKTLSKEDFNKVSVAMDDSYAEIRSYLNTLDKLPSVKDIKRDWPFLLKYPILLDHFCKLTEKNPRNVINCYAEKNKNILNYFERSKPKIAAQAYKNYSDNYQCTLNAVCAYFKENEGCIFKNYQIGTTLEEILQPGTHPWIAIIESENSSIYYLYADGELVNRDAASFPEALVQCFCLYFVLNIEFPRTASQTLDFIQRFYFEFYTEVSRGKKKNLSAMSKVIRLLQEIMFFH